MAGNEVDLDFAVRLLVASVCGAVIGFERELHDKPAGMRTHLLLALGSAIFAVVSAHGFASTQTTIVDPSRIAAQIVAGVGFLGAGAIIKDGASVRGLTTAASLWATAAIGLAAGAATYGIALMGTVLVVLSLWPLDLIVGRFRLGGSEVWRVRLRLANLAPITAVLERASAEHLSLDGVESRSLGNGRYDIDISLRSAHPGAATKFLDDLARIPDVRVRESRRDPR